MLALPSFVQKFCLSQMMVGWGLPKVMSVEMNVAGLAMDHAGVLGIASPTMAVEVIMTRLCFWNRSGCVDTSGVLQKLDPVPLFD